MDWVDRWVEAGVVPPPCSFAPTQRDEIAERDPSCRSVCAADPHPPATPIVLAVFGAGFNWGAILVLPS